MFAERRLAFLTRINQILEATWRAGNRKITHAERFDLQSRFLSALEDAYQMGLKQSKGEIIIDEAPEPPDTTA